MDRDHAPRDEQHGRAAEGSPPRALDATDRLSARLRGRHVALFLDYDGTLTPIVERPELARLSARMREALQASAAVMPVAIVSGRDLADVRSMVGLPDLVYAGSHGFDIAGPQGLRLEHREASGVIGDLDRAERALRLRVDRIEGAWLERKRFALAIHYRQVNPDDVPALERDVRAVRQSSPTLRLKGGKKIFEFQPDVAWDKGRAVVWLLEQLGLDRPEVLPIYIGDDVTDEDAFRALRARGIGVRVGAVDEPTEADYLLRDTDEVRGLLELLARMASAT